MGNNNSLNTRRSSSKTVDTSAKVKLQEEFTREGEASIKKLENTQIIEEHFADDAVDIDIPPELEEQSRKLSSKDFQIERLLGQGTRGKVTIVRYHDGTIYAMKTLYKKNLKKSLKVENTKRERK